VIRYVFITFISVEQWRSQNFFDRGCVASLVCNDVARRICIGVGELNRGVKVVKGGNGFAGYP